MMVSDKVEKGIKKKAGMTNMCGGIMCLRDCQMTICWLNEGTQRGNHTTGIVLVVFS